MGYYKHNNTINSHVQIFFNKLIKVKEILVCALHFFLYTCVVLELDAIKDRLRLKDIYAFNLGFVLYKNVPLRRSISWWVGFH